MKSPLRDVNSISARMSQYCPGLSPFIPISDELEILVVQFLIFAATNYTPNPGRAHPDYILYFAFGMGGKNKIIIYVCNLRSLVWWPEAYFLFLHGESLEVAKFLRSGGATPVLRQGRV